MKYGEVYIITKEFEFDNAFETREAADWYNDNKETADLQRDLDKYIEISRILLRENLDIKDYLKDKAISLDMNLIDLNDLFSCFSEQESDKSDDSESEDKNNEV